MGSKDTEQKCDSAIYTGAALKQYMKEKGIAGYRKRECAEELEDYLRGRDKRILGLCGLSGTGRTGLLCQAVESLSRYEESALIICSGEDRVADLTQILSDMKCRYIFLDNVSVLSDFQENCGLLAELPAQAGRKVMLTGGEALIPAEEGALAGSIRLIGTSYLSFREFQLIKSGSLAEYLRYRSERCEEGIIAIEGRYSEGGVGLSGRVRQILRAMDVLADLPEAGRRHRTVFTQPGLIQSQTDMEPDAQETMLRRKERDVIATDLVKDPMVSGAHLITNYHSDGGEEFDLVIINKKARRCAVIRVESTDRQEESQVRDLTDDALCRELQEYFSCRLAGRYVLYHGRSGRAFKVQYINSEEFLNRGAGFRTVMEKLDP